MPLPTAPKQCTSASVCDQSSFFGIDDVTASQQRPPLIRSTAGGGDGTRQQRRRNIPSVTSIAPLRVTPYRSDDEENNARVDTHKALTTTAPLPPTPTGGARCGKLPSNWAPTSVDYDNVTCHRLWKLSDGSNAYAFPADTEVVGHDATRASVEWSPHSLQSQGSSYKGGGGELVIALPSIGSEGGDLLASGDSTLRTQEGDRPSPAVMRPMSGDTLLRTYQLRTIFASGGFATAKTGMHAALPPRHTPPPLVTQTGGLTQSDFTMLARSATTTTSSGGRVYSPPAAATLRHCATLTAQSRISSAAARIAAVGKSLNSAALLNSQPLQRALEAEKERTDALLEAELVAKEARSRLSPLRREETRGVRAPGDGRMVSICLDDVAGSAGSATPSAFFSSPFTASHRSSGGAPQQSFSSSGNPSGSPTPRHVAATPNDSAVGEDLLLSDELIRTLQLSDEDVLYLLSLAGGEGIMSNEAITESMWDLEHENLRDRGGSVAVVSDPLPHVGTDTVDPVQVHEPRDTPPLLAPKSPLRRKSIDRKTPTGGSSMAFLTVAGGNCGDNDEGTSPRRTPRSPTAAETKKKQPKGLQQSERLSAVLTKKMRALEEAQAMSLPTITLSSLDVRHEESHLRKRLASLNGKLLQGRHSIGEVVFSQVLSGGGEDHTQHSAFDDLKEHGKPKTLEKRILDRSNGNAIDAQKSLRMSASKSIVDFLGQPAKRVVPEGDTYIPSNELHLYQLYCINTNTVIIFRPVSPSVPPMYAGNFFVPSQYCDHDGIPLTVNEINGSLTLKEILSFTRAECRVKGKGIGVSLKSSPYPPIDGFIPTNPSLSKTYSEARKKERALEDNLINAAGGGDAMSTALLRKIRSQRSLFGAATSVAMKEIEASLKDSDKRLNALLEKYNTESSYSVDKLAVSEAYIGMLNESQFLGKAIATWRGLPIYFKQAPGDTDVERRENSHPYFYCKKGNELAVYDLDRNELDITRTVSITSPSMLEELYHPVYILTHKSFVISPISKRIEADPSGDFLIGPDFDGFAYATQTRADGTADSYVKFSEDQMKLRVLPTMGLVNDIDIDHILDMRRLTEWKQSHGYECSNTLKTQEISDGPHVIIMPNDEIRIASNFPELMDFYREAWQCGYPLLLNPNWKVVLSPLNHLPVPFGEELNIPVVDDCGLALVKHHLSGVGKKFDDLKEEAHHYIEELTAMRKQGITRARVGGMYSTSLMPRVAIVVARKDLANTFYNLRRWMLFPPMFDPRFRKSFDQPPGNALGTSAAFRSRSKGGGSTADTAPILSSFEEYRAKKVNELRAVFEEECQVFDALFGAEDSRFVKKLKMFIDPTLAAQASLSHEAAKVQTNIGKTYLTVPEEGNSAKAIDSAATRLGASSVERPFT